MRRLLLACLLLGLAGTSPADDEQDPAPQVEAPGPGEAATERSRPPGKEEVEKAVARGVAWLRARKSRDGSIGNGPGETALSLLALRHSLVEDDDPVCRGAAAYLERELPDGTVYGAALGVVALLAQDVGRHEKKVTELVEDLATGQCTNGQWTYAYRLTARKKSGDNSNTQFAVLALGAARAQGIRVPKAPFVRCRKFLRGSQNEDGGFGYSDKERSRSYGSMTAGGAMALRICAAGEMETRITDPVLDDLEEVRRALAWLGSEFEPGVNRGASSAFGGRRKRVSDGFWKHYYLWSVERACSVAGVEEIGKDAHAWYSEGARHLLDSQREDGSWLGPETGLRATSFALLFFARSTRRVITPSGGRRVSTPDTR